MIDMVYGVILAGGIGRRMGTSIPKQYIKINGVPIIIYTLRSMIMVKRIDKIYIAVAKEYIAYMKQLVQEYFDKYFVEKIFIIEGGQERIDTIMNVTNQIVVQNTIGDDDIVIFHDAVRPFVTEKILNDSIDGAKKYKAVVAGIQAVDTIMCSEDGKQVNRILKRDTIFHGQAPDSFNLKYFINLADRLTEIQKKNLTGTSQFCSFNHEPIYMIPGDEINFKITTNDDLKRAILLIQEKEGLKDEGAKFIWNK